MKFLGIRLDSHTLGNLIKNVSPALAFTPLGLAGAGAAAALGGKLRGESTGQAIRSGLSNAAIGGGVRLGAGVLKGAKLALDSGASFGDTLGAVKGELGQEAMDRFRPVGSFLKNNARTIADVGTAGEHVYDRMLENNAVNDAQRRYRALQPLRDQAMADLMQPTPNVDTAALFADPGNPQGRYRRVNVGSAGRY